MATVMGPTPPGTGVMADATACAEGNSTSPTSRPSGSRLMPTSTTTAPGRSQLPFTSSGRPTAATSTSASRQMAGRSRVREWQMVTVALRPKSSRAVGRPTMVLRPTTTARAPSSGTPAWSSRASTPAGVHGTRYGRPDARRPTLTGWKPSTSLRGSMRSRNSSAARWPGSGSCSRMP